MVDRGRRRQSQIATASAFIDTMRTISPDAHDAGIMHGLRHSAVTLLQGHFLDDLIWQASSARRLSSPARGHMQMCEFTEAQRMAASACAS